MCEWGNDDWLIRMLGHQNLTYSVLIDLEPMSIGTIAKQLINPEGKGRRVASIACVDIKLMLHHVASSLNHYHIRYYFPQTCRLGPFLCKSLGNLFPWSRPLNSTIGSIGHTFFFFWKGVEFEGSSTVSFQQNVWKIAYDHVSQEQYYLQAEVKGMAAVAANKG